MRTTVMTPREVVATQRAEALAPYFIDTVLRVKAGRVHYSEERIAELYEVVAAMAPIIDRAEIPETDKLFLNAAFSFILRSRDGGQLTPRRKALLLGFLNATRDFIEAGLDFCEVESLEVVDAPAPAALQDHP